MTQKRFNKLLKDQNKEAFILKSQNKESKEKNEEEYDDCGQSYYEEPLYGCGGY